MVARLGVIPGVQGVAVHHPVDVNEDECVNGRGCGYVLLQPAVLVLTMRRQQLQRQLPAIPSTEAEP